MSRYIPDNSSSSSRVCVYRLHVTTRNSRMTSSVGGPMSGRNPKIESPVDLDTRAKGGVDSLPTEPLRYYWK